MPQEADAMGNFSDNVGTQSVVDSKGFETNCLRNFFQNSVSRAWLQCFEYRS